MVFLFFFVLMMILYKKSERTNNSTSKLKTRKKLFGVIFKKPQPLFIQKTLTTLTLTLTFKL